MKEYAFYKGENLLAMGTLEEIAKEMGVATMTMFYYKSNAYLKRLERENRLDGNVRMLVPLDGDDLHG